MDWFKQFFTSTYNLEYFHSCKSHKKSISKNKNIWLTSSYLIFFSFSTHFLVIYNTVNGYISKHSNLKDFQIQFHTIYSFGKIEKDCTTKFSACGIKNTWFNVLPLSKATPLADSSTMTSCSQYDGKVRSPPRRHLTANRKCGLGHDTGRRLQSLRTRSAGERKSPLLQRSAQLRHREMNQPIFLCTQLFIFFLILNCFVF